MRMKLRTKQRRATLVVGALLLALTVATFGLTHSTTRKAVPKTSALAQAPEAESPYGKADPDEYLDLKESSAQSVSASEIKRAQAQAADVPAAAGGISWQQLGPYNIGGRVIDVVVDKQRANSDLHGGLGRRHLAQHRRRRELDVASGPTTTCRRSARSPRRRRHAVGRHRRGEPARRRPDLLRRRHLQAPTDGGAPWPNMRPHRQRLVRPDRRRPAEPEPHLRGGRAATSPAACSQRGIYRSTDGGADVAAGARADRTTTTGAADVAIDPVEPADRLRVAVGSPPQQRRAHLRRRRLGPVPLHDGGDTWARLRTSSTRCRRTTGPDRAHPARRSAASASRSRRATRTASTSSSANRRRRQGLLLVSNDGGDSFTSAAAPAAYSRLRVVVRPPLGRPR